MISQALSVSWQRNSEKSGASEDFQFQTGNSHTRVKTYVTPNAGGLGGKMIKPSILGWFCNDSCHKFRCLSELLMLNDYHQLTSLTVWNVSQDKLSHNFFFNFLTSYLCVRLSTQPISCELYSPSPAELLQGFVSWSGSGITAPCRFTPLAAVCWGLAPSSCRETVCCILL